ncbi:MAG: RluA family pseudouridine synthase [Actinobacteria bacterium]|nr:RluA family pseudouridine synthase [Actinomycetota bacterium]
MPDVVIDETDAGERLDVALARSLGMPRARVARLIDSGAVSIEGSSASRSFRVEPGMRISVTLDEPAAPPAAEEIALRIVYEDRWLLVVSKPAGLVTHPSPGHASGTVVNAVLALGARGGDPERPGIVHRLDAGTSGLMIVARDDTAYERLAAAMAGREVTRVYLALVEGEPKTDTYTIDAPIGRSQKHRQKMAVVAEGKEAVTDVTVLERLAGCALVEARPRTGRTHQIRVHLEAAGHAVLGDPVYGHERKLARALGLDRIFLHATRLLFTHPMTDEPLDLQDALPPELAEVLARAGARG